MPKYKKMYLVFFLNIGKKKILTTVIVIIHIINTLPHHSVMFAEYLTLE